MNEYLSQEEYERQKQAIYGAFYSLYKKCPNIFVFQKKSSKIGNDLQNKSLRCYRQRIYKRFYEYMEERERRRFDNRLYGGSIRGLFREASAISHKGSAYEQTGRINPKLIYIAKK